MFIFFLSMSIGCLLPVSYSISFFRVLTILILELFHFLVLIYCEVSIFLKAVVNGAVPLFLSQSTNGI